VTQLRRLVRRPVSGAVMSGLYPMETISEVRMLAVTSNPSTLPRLLVTANVVPSSVIFFILMMDVVSSFETSVITRATRRHIPEDGIIQL
jgi:hypothetical protein